MSEVDAIDGVSVIALDENVGFGRACNVGMAHATGDVVLLNNDTVVTAGWLERMAAHATGPVGLVGPTANWVADHQRLEPGYGDDLRDLDAFAGRVAHEFSGRRRLVEWVSGVCLYVRRDVIAAIGGFDPAYGLGNYEDIDYSIRARASGRQCAIALDTFIHHRGSRTFARIGADWSRQMDTNFAYFKQKWALPDELGRTDRFEFDPIVEGGPNPARDFVPLPAANPAAFGG